MNPKTFLQRILDAVKFASQVNSAWSNDWQKAFNCCTDLFDYLNGGGIAPSLPPSTYISLGDGGRVAYSVLSNPTRVGGGVFIRSAFCPDEGQYVETHRFVLATV